MTDQSFLEIASENSTGQGEEAVPTQSQTEESGNLAFLGTLSVTSMTLRRDWQVFLALGKGERLFELLADSQTLQPMHFQVETTPIKRLTMMTPAALHVARAISGNQSPTPEEIQVCGGALVFPGRWALIVGADYQFWKKTLKTSFATVNFDSANLGKDGSLTPETSELLKQALLGMRRDVSWLQASSKAHALAFVMAIVALAIGFKYISRRIGSRQKPE